ncbi:hypothetical protein BSP7_065 [Bacillus phage BSP7]|nr:hypothetical protein BSP7_065 [Bacillus phage BSP7]
MKKVTMVLTCLTLVILGFVSVPKAEAAWSGWQSLTTGYTGRVYTDATTYTSRASTIDWKVEKKGSSKVYYTAKLYKWNNNGLVYTGQSAGGYFFYSTPLKSFSVPKARKATGNGGYQIKVELYNSYIKDKAHYKGTLNSSKFYITDGV